MAVSTLAAACSGSSALDTASPALGILSVAVSTLLSVAVLVALVLLIGEARATHHATTPGSTSRGRTLKDS